MGVTTTGTSSGLAVVYRPPDPSEAVTTASLTSAVAGVGDVTSDRVGVEVVSGE